MSKILLLGILGLADLALVIQQAAARLPAPVRLLTVPFVMVPVVIACVLLGMSNLVMMCGAVWSLGKGFVALAATPDPEFIDGIIQRERLVAKVVGIAFDKSRPIEERDAAKADLTGCMAHLAQWVASRGEADGPGFEA